MSKDNWPKTGDSLTIAGHYEMIRNPDRGWWQWWKPKHVKGPNLRKWTIIAQHSSLGYIAQ